MASSGRPTERPVHISAGQRRTAQQQTSQWRTSAKLSRVEMAARVMVALSTYRHWESSSEPNAGPTQVQAALLDRVLRQLLGSAYEDGAALRIWGWPPAENMTYDHVADV